MKNVIALFLIAVVCLFAQPIPVKLRGIQFDYPANQIPDVFFWFEKKTNVDMPRWEVMATITMPDPDSGSQPMAFYRVGVDWRSNAPSWMTNYSLPPTNSSVTLIRKFVTAKPPKIP